MFFIVFIVVLYIILRNGVAVLANVLKRYVGVEVLYEWYCLVCLRNITFIHPFITTSIESVSVSSAILNSSFTKWFVVCLHTTNIQLNLPSKEPLTSNNQDEEMNGWRDEVNKLWKQVQLPYHSITNYILSFFSSFIGFHLTDVSVSLNQRSNDITNATKNDFKNILVNNNRNNSNNKNDKNNNDSNNINKHQIKNEKMATKLTASQLSFHVEDDMEQRCMQSLYLKVDCLITTTFLFSGSQENEKELGNMICSSVIKILFSNNHVLSLQDINFTLYNVQASLSKDGLCYFANHFQGLSKRSQFDSFEMTLDSSSLQINKQHSCIVIKNMQINSNTDPLLSLSWASADINTMEEEADDIGIQLQSTHFDINHHHLLHSHSIIQHLFKINKTKKKTLEKSSNVRKKRGVRWSIHMGDTLFNIKTNHHSYNVYPTRNNQSNLYYNNYDQYQKNYNTTSNNISSNDSSNQINTHLLCASNSLKLGVFQSIEDTSVDFESSNMYVKVVSKQNTAFTTHYTNATSSTHHTNLNSKRHYWDTIFFNGLTLIKLSGKSGVVESMVDSVQLQLSQRVFEMLVVVLNGMLGKENDGSQSSNKVCEKDVEEEAGNEKKKLKTQNDLSFSHHDDNEDSNDVEDSNIRLLDNPVEDCDKYSECAVDDSSDEEDGDEEKRVHLTITCVNVFFCHQNSTTMMLRCDSATFNHQLHLRHRQANICGVKALYFTRKNKYCTISRSSDIVNEIFSLLECNVVHNKRGLKVVVDEGVAVSWSSGAHLLVTHIHHSFVSLQKQIYDCLDFSQRVNKNDIDEYNKSSNKSCCNKLSKNKNFNYTSKNNNNGKKDSNKSTNISISVKQKIEVMVKMSADHFSRIRLSNTHFTPSNFTISSITVSTDQHPFLTLKNLVIQEDQQGQQLQQHRLMSFTTLQQQRNRAWIVAADECDITFAFNYDFHSWLHATKMVRKWVMGTEEVKKVLPADFSVVFKIFTIQLSDDPFEVKLADNYEMMYDESLENERRMNAMANRVEEMKMNNQHVTDRRVETWYRGLSEKRAQIYIQRSHLMYSSQSPIRTQLCQWLFEDFCVFSLTDPNLYGEDKCREFIKKVNKESPFPENMRFNTTFLREVSLTSSTVLFTLRDFNEAMLDMQKFELKGLLCGAEKDGGKRGQRQVPFQFDVPWGSTTLTTNLPPLKYFYDFKIDIKNYTLTYGSCWEPIVAQISHSLNKVLRPTIDPSAPMPFWDKWRYMLHGNIEARMERSSWRSHCSLQPCNSTEFLDWVWSGLCFKWTTGVISWQGDLEVLLRTASKYDECCLASWKQLLLSFELDWQCRGECNDHHTISPSTLHFLKQHALLHNYDTFRDFRSSSLKLTCSMTTLKPTSEPPTASSSSLPPTSYSSPLLSSSPSATFPRTTSFPLGPSSASSLPRLASLSTHSSPSSPSPSTHFHPFSSPKQPPTQAVLSCTLYSSTVRWLQQLNNCLRRVSRPIKRGSYYKTAATTKPKLTKHISFMSLKLESTSINLSYWSSFRRSFGVELETANSSLSLSCQVSMVPNLKPPPLPFNQASVRLSSLKRQQRQQQQNQLQKQQTQTAQSESLQSEHSSLSQQHALSQLKQQHSLPQLQNNKPKHANFFSFSEQSTSSTSSLLSNFKTSHTDSDKLPPFQESFPKQNTTSPSFHPTTSHPFHCTPSTSFHHNQNTLSDSDTLTHTSHQTTSTPSHHTTSLPPLKRRAIKKVDISKLQCKLSSVVVWLSSKVHQRKSKLRVSKSEKSFLLSVDDVLYKRSDETNQNKSLEQADQEVEVFNLKACWTPHNRDILFSLHDTYMKSQMLLRNLSADALKTIKLESSASTNKRTVKMNSPHSSSPHSTNSTNPSDLLLQKLIEERASKFVAFHEEMGGERVDVNQLQGYNVCQTNDVMHKHLTVSLRNCQVMLSGCETSGYIIVSTPSASLHHSLHAPIITPTHQLKTKSSILGSIESMQYFATISDEIQAENIKWLSNHDIQDRDNNKNKKENKDTGNKKKDSCDWNIKKKKENDGNKKKEDNTKNKESNSKNNKDDGKKDNKKKKMLKKKNKALVVDSSVESKEGDDEKDDEACVSDDNDEQKGFLNIENLINNFDDIQTDVSQLQRIISRCRCQFYWCWHGDVEDDDALLELQADALEEGGIDTTKEGIDAFTLVHHDLNISTNSTQYATALDIVNNLLLYTEPKKKELNEKLLDMRFSLMITNVVADYKNLIFDKQKKLRKLVEQLKFAEKEVYLIQRTELRAEDQYEMDMMAKMEWLKEQVNIVSEELALLLNCYRESQLQMLSEKQATLKKKEVGMRRKIDLFLRHVEWRLNEEDAQSGICHIILSDFLYTQMLQENDCGSHQMELGGCHVGNLLPEDAPYKDVLVPQDLIGATLLDSKEVVVRLLCKFRPHVGGIAVKEHFELNVAPLALQMTARLYSIAMPFFFPGKAADDSDDDVSDAEEGGSVQTNTLSATSKNKKSLKKKSHKRVPSTNDIDRMKERAALNNMFVYIKISEVPLKVTYKSGKEKHIMNINNFHFSSPSIEYHNRTWSWHDLTMNIKRDCKKVLVAQAVKQKLHIKSRKGLSNLVLPHSSQLEDASKLLLGLSLFEKKPKKNKKKGLFHKS